MMCARLIAVLAPLVASVEGRFHLRRYGKSHPTILEIPSALHPRSINSMSGNLEVNWSRPIGLPMQRYYSPSPRRLQHHAFCQQVQGRDLRILLVYLPNTKVELRLGDPILLLCFRHVTVQQIQVNKRFDYPETNTSEDTYPMYKKRGNLNGKVSIEPSKKHSMMLESVFHTSTQTQSQLNPPISPKPQKLKWLD